MKDKRKNRAAAGYLLLAVGTAGRVLLGLPAETSAAEVTLTVLLLVGALLLGPEGLRPALCAVGCAAAEIYLLSVAAAPLYGAIARLADLWLWFAAACLTLGPAAATQPEDRRKKYRTGGRRCILVLMLLLVAETELRIAAVLAPDVPALATAAAWLFVAYSVAMLWYAAWMLRAYRGVRGAGNSN